MKEEDLLSREEKTLLKSEVKYLKSYTDGNPGTTVLMMIALAIGIGTVIGWKRIVVTIGEKIGKTHMTYGQGATAEIVAASTIGLSTYFGLPVSTTHVLTSGVAGSMVATGGVKNLQKGTIKNIALAWILTLPVTMLLSLGLYLIFRLFI
jgi:PiT family inorganic phosphate transporter